MSVLKKCRALLSLALCAVLVCAAVPAASAAEVTSYTGSINGNTAKLVLVPMSGRTGSLVLAGDSVVQDAKAADLIAKGKTTGNVAAAINGGFFNSYYKTSKELAFPGNCPQIFNTIVLDNMLVNAGGYKPVLGFTPEGRPMIDKVKFVPVIELGSGFAPRTWGANYLYNDPYAIMFFTDEMTLPVEIPADSTMYFIRDGVVTDIRPGGTLVVPKDTYVLVYNSIVHEFEATIGTDKGYGRVPKLGETARVRYEVDELTRPQDKEIWESMETVVGGGSILLLDGQIVTDQNPEFTEAKQQPNYKALRSFVGITWQGDLLMGTVTATFNQIAAWLQANGVKDALAMDGGASSMLYASGSGTVTSAGRKLASILTIVDAARPSPCSVLVDGQSVEFQMYALADENGNLTNYVKIRDLASILDGTGAQFEVAWDGGISLTSGQRYTPNGSEMDTPYSGVQPYILPAYTVKVNGTPVSLATIGLKGGAYNYCKLADLARALDFDVHWDGALGSIVLNTDRPYGANG